MPNRTDSDVSAQPPTASTATTAAPQPLPPLEVLVGEIVGIGADALQEIKAGEWVLTRYGQEEEPRVSDLELARHLGYSEPRAIRKLIKRMISQDRLPGEIHVRSTMSRTSMPRGGVREVYEEAYSVTEKQALKVSTQSKTPKANQITDRLIDVYIAVRKGTPPAQPSLATPAPSHLPLEILKAQQALNAQQHVSAQARMRHRLVFDLLDDPGLSPENKRELRIKTLEALDGNGPWLGVRPNEQPARPTVLVTAQGIPSERSLTCSDMEAMWRVPKATIGRVAKSKGIQTPPHAYMTEHASNEGHPYVMWHYSPVAVNALREHFGRA